MINTTTAMENMLHFGNLISYHFSSKRCYITQPFLYDIQYERIMNGFYDGLYMCVCVCQRVIIHNGVHALYVTTSVECVQMILLAPMNTQVNV